MALRASLAISALLLGDLLCNRLFLEDGIFLQRCVAPFDPPMFSPSQRETLQRIEAELARSPAPAPGKFDAELGWCNKPNSGFGDFRYDWAGARIGAGPLTREKPPGTRRVIAIGCSMTHGEDVGPRETWCAQVDEACPEIEVANLGVAAYGLDQALLRLRRDGPGLAADEVWLGVLPQAALRNTTLFRPLLDHWSLDVAFKPRFSLSAEGALELVANPVGSLQDIPRLLHDQGLLLGALGDGDPWIRRAPVAYAPRGSHWMHWFFATRLLLTLHEAGGRELEACFTEATEFGRLFAAIVRATAQETRAQGAAFRLLILPGKDDLIYRQANGKGYWEDWARRCREEGMQVLDLSAALLGSGLPLDQLFASHGHYAPEAGHFVAQAILTDIAP